jgi:hypothetical protein
MNRLSELIGELDICYRLKTENVEDYLRLSKADRKNLCMNSRQKLMDYVNSDKLLMSNMINERIQVVKGKNTYNKNYNRPIPYWRPYSQLQSLENTII